MRSRHVGWLLAPLCVLLALRAFAQDDAAARLRKGIALQAAGRSTEARSEYEAALRLRPDLVEAEVRLGLLLLELGPRDRGLALLEAAAPRVEPAVLLAIGAALFRAGAMDAAQRHLERAAGLDPRLASVDTLLGQVYSAQGQHAKAIERLERAVEREPNSPMPRTLLGITLSLRGDKERSVAELERAATLGPDNPAVHYYLGLARLDLLRYPEAVTALERAAALDADDRDTALNLAWALLGQGRPQAAAERLLELERRRPRDAVVAFLLGESQRRAGDVDGALAAYGRALQIDARMLDARFSRGTVHYLRREVGPARADYEQLLRFEPRHPGAHYQLGKLLLEEGRLEEALDHLVASALADPANGAVRFQLARAYRRLGRSEEARREAALFRKLKAESEEGAAWRKDPLPARPAGH